MRAPYLILLATAMFATSAIAEVPIATDSRIKTLVYNANEVFTVTTHYGYQSNIEFGAKESIETVSVGDRVAWQIIPAGRRLFIRAMEENATTNMTVVTNLRAYQFDLRSSSADAVFGSEELTYVVRFYYPGESTGAMPVSYRTPVAPIMSEPTVMQSPIMPVSTAPVYHSNTPTYAAPAPAPSYQPAQAYNYRYTFSGPSTVAPVKIYDDGRSTYFKFRGTVPQFAIVSAAGEEIPVATRPVEPGIVAVDRIAPRFSLRSNGTQVVVYNESNGA